MSIFDTTYLMKRFPYEELKQKQFNKYLASYEGYLYTNKAAILKYIKKNTANKKDIVEKVANRAGISEETVSKLLSEMEREKLIRKKTQLFRDSIYEALVEEMPEPHELSVIRDSNGVQISDEFDEAPEFRNSSIPEPDFMQLEKEIDAFIDGYDV